MKISKGTFIAIVVLIVWLILSWMLGTWLHLKSPNLWLLRGGLALIGIIGFVGYLLVIRSSKPKAPASQSNGGGVAQDIDLVFAEAANRLRSSNLAHAKGVAALPAIFILGDSNTAKTSVLAHSGLEAELLAGQAYQDNLVTPTKVVNLWFARRIVFVDPAGRIVADPAARRKLFHKFAPGRRRICARWRRTSGTRGCCHARLRELSGAGGRGSYCRQSAPVASDAWRTGPGTRNQLSRLRSVHQSRPAAVFSRICRKPDRARSGRDFRGHPFRWKRRGPVSMPKSRHAV